MSSTFGGAGGHVTSLSVETAVKLSFPLSKQAAQPARRPSFLPSFLPYIGAKPKIVMLRDMAPDIEDSFCQLIELSQKGLYDRGRISKHN